MNSFTKMTPSKKKQPFLKAKQAKKNLHLLLLSWSFPRPRWTELPPSSICTIQAAANCDAEDGEMGLF